MLSARDTDITMHCGVDKLINYHWLMAKLSFFERDRTDIINHLANAMDYRFERAMEVFRCENIGISRL